MPARTNPFQQLIHLVAQQLDENARVIHSATLYDELAKMPRECDVLVVGTAQGLPTLMAIEVRDRGRPATVEWIDELWGKYRDLTYEGRKVTRIVAVSSSGFRLKARTMAALRGIETMTAREASAADWAQIFGDSIHALRGLIYTWRLLSTRVEPRQPDGTFDGLLTTDGMVIGSAGEAEGSISDLWERTTTNDDLRRSVDAEMIGEGATRGQISYQWPAGTTLRFLSGLSLPLEGVTFTFVVHRRVAPSATPLRVVSLDSTGESKAAIVRLAALDGSIALDVALGPDQAVATNIVQGPQPTDLGKVTSLSMEA